MKRPTCGPLLILFRALKCSGLDGKLYVANLLHGEVLIISSPSVRRRGPTRPQGVCSPFPTFWPSLMLYPALKRWGPPDGGLPGFVANVPLFGPMLISSPPLTCWGPPRRRSVCSQCAHFWATIHILPPPKRWGPARRQSVCSQFALLRAIDDLISITGQASVM